MSNPIPPLLSSTPPPIDDNDIKTLDNYDDDDNNDCDNFDKFENVINNSSEGLSLPSTPRHLNDIHDRSDPTVTTSNSKTIDEKLEHNFEKLKVTDGINRTNEIKNSENYNYGLEDTNESNSVIDTNSTVKNCSPIVDSIFVRMESISKNQEFLENVPDLNEVVTKDEVNLNNLKLNEKRNEVDITKANRKLDYICDDNNDTSHSQVFEETKELNVFNYKEDNYENENGQSTVNENSFFQSQVIASENNNDSETKYSFDFDSDYNFEICTSEKKTETILNSLDITLNKSLPNKTEENQGLDSEKNICKNDIETNAFEADFSQFESFDFHQFPEPLSINNKNQTLENNISLEEDDFDDDFDNFQHFDSSEPKSFELKASKSEDDFGEFSASLPPVQSICSNIQTNNENLFDKVTKVLTNVFPSIDKNKEEEDIKILDKIELNLNAVERAHCLDFLYNKSNVKTSLIKSLGIDTRNILYGENWSSGIPRFAANLGFSPLEPIKPVVVDSMPGNMSSISDSQSQNPTTENVQFNWIEPITENLSTASQAHTLLLDLDQLMVMANVDNIKIDSSSSPCSSKYYDVTTKSTTNYLIFDSTQLNDSDIGGGECCDDNSTNKYQYDNYLFEHYLDSRIEENLSKGKIEAFHEKESNQSNKSIEKSTIPYEKSSIISTSSSTVIIESESNEIIKNNEYGDKSNDACKTTSLPILVNNDLNIDYFGSNQEISEIIEKPDDRQMLEQIKTPFHMTSTASYMVPLKETHIFTPSKTDKPISQTTNDIIDFEMAAAAAGTVIDETVIKKEYHDIEYEPKKLTMPNMNLPAEHVIFEHKNKMKSFHSIIPVENIAENNTNLVWDEELSKTAEPKKDISTTFPKDSEMYPSSLHPNNNKFEGVLTELNNFECNLNLNDSKKYLENSPNNLNLDNSKKNISLQNSNVNTILEFPPEIKECQIKDESKNCASFDDEFSDFQSVPPTINNNVMQAIANDKLNNFKSLPNSRTNTPTNMILSPAVLLPQSVKIKKHEPKIEWPEPGINPDELARIETLYPQKLTSNYEKHFENKKLDHNILVDDDWSDFVSVPPPPSKQSSLNTIYCPKSPTKVSTGVIRKSQNHLAIDDDEWSDFVSNTPISQQNQINSNCTINSQKNFNHSGANKSIKNLHGSQNTATISNVQKYSLSTSQQYASQNFVPTIQNNFKSNFLANNKPNLVNNKMSQYLLNNSSSNEPKNFVQMNTSLKPQDFISNHHQQTFNNQFKNINNQNNSSNTKTKSNNPVSLIPNLGFIPPIQNFNKSRNQKFIQKK